MAPLKYMNFQSKLKSVLPIFHVISFFYTPHICCWSGPSVRKFAHHLSRTTFDSLYPPMRVVVTKALTIKQMYF